jgi:hypothetical protein
MIRNFQVFTLLVALVAAASTVCHTALAFTLVSPYSSSLSSSLSLSRTKLIFASVKDDDDDDNVEDVSLEAFQARKMNQQAPQQQDDEEEEEEFDGYVLRDILLEKWGKAYDLEFNKVDHLGARNLYLNVMPFHMGGRQFRHASELEYLCHLQAVVEILLKYNQVRVKCSVRMFLNKHVPQVFLFERLTSNNPLYKDWKCTHPNR